MTNMVTKEFRYDGKLQCALTPYVEDGFMVQEWTYEDDFRQYKDGPMGGETINIRAMNENMPLADMIAYIERKAKSLIAEGFECDGRCSIAEWLTSSKGRGVVHFRKGGRYE